MTEGYTDGTYSIMVDGIKEKDLHYFEAEILNLFGKHKVGKGYTKAKAAKELKKMRELLEYKNKKFLKD